MVKTDLLDNRRYISKTVFYSVLSEMFFSFLICFCFFFFIFFVNQILLLAREVLEKHVPFFQVVLLIIYSLPSVIALSAPFACLVGTLMTVGRLTSDNEILVMLTSGLSYKNVFFPAILMGIIISLLSFFTNDVLLPAGTVQFNKLWRSIAVSTPALELQANSIKRFNNTIIVTGGVSKNVIYNLLIIDRTIDGERRIIVAKSAELVDSGKDGISLNLQDAFIHSSKEMKRDDYDYADTETLQYWVSNEDIIQAVVSITPREMSSRDVMAAINQKRTEIAVRTDERKKRLFNQAMIIENVLRAGPESEDWNKRESFSSILNREYSAVKSIQNDRTLTNYLVEINRKFSVPFGAFCFVFLAVSIGLMAKKSGQTVGFIFGILFAVAYWSMLFIGQTMALRAVTPPFWSMWTPNFVFLILGVVLAVLRIRK